MKKVLLVLIMLVIITPAYSYEYFELGKNSYSRGLYGEAKEYLQLAVKNKPKNNTYRYYYAHSLLKLGMIEEAAEQYQIIMLNAPNSLEGIEASKTLTTIHKYFENQTGTGEFKTTQPYDENYISYLILEDKSLPHWTKNTINVYIYPSDSSDIAEKAFNTWATKSNGLVKFNFVPAKDVADITVKYVDKIHTIEAAAGFQQSYSAIKYVDKNINHVDVTIQNKYQDTKEAVNPDILYLTTLHEIGHAIGLNGHSDSSSDIMYFELTKNTKGISQRDINTLKALYNINPTDAEELKGNPTIYAIKLNIAKEYVAAYPDLPSAWSELSAAYVAIDDYDKAIESIKKAIELKGDDTVLNTQLANYYMKTNNVDEAINLYKHVYEMQPDNKVLLYNWAKACYKNKRAEEAKEAVDQYLMGPGFLANDEISRLLRRMYKQDKTKEQEKLKADKEAREKKQAELEELDEETY